MKNLPRKKEEEPHSKTEALSVDIVLHTNATPCKGCANNLVQFKKKLEDNHSKVTLKIKFSSLSSNEIRVENVIMLQQRITIIKTMQKVLKKCHIQNLSCHDLDMLIGKFLKENSRYNLNT